MLGWRWVSDTRRSSRPPRRGRGLKPSAGTAGALRASRPATRGVDATPMPGRAIEHGDGAHVERRRAGPHSRGLLSPGQVLSPTNAAPTKHETAQHENTVRGGAFAHTSTEKGQWPFAHRQASERPRTELRSPATRKERAMKMTESIRRVSGHHHRRRRSGCLRSSPQTRPPKKSP